MRGGNRLVLSGWMLLVIAGVLVVVLPTVLGDIAAGGGRDQLEMILLDQVLRVVSTLAAPLGAALLACGLTVAYLERGEKEHNASEVP